MTYSLTGLLRQMFPPPIKRELPAAINTSIGVVDYIAGCMNAAQALSTVTVVADNLLAIPFWSPPYPTTVGRIAFENTGTAGGANANIAIYENVADVKSLYPGALVEESGDISIATAALKTYSSSAVLKSSRLYWMVLNVSSNVVCRAMLGISVYPMLGIVKDTTTANPFNEYILVASTYGAMPSTFPVSAAYVSGNVNVPMLRYQFTA